MRIYRVLSLIVALTIAFTIKSWCQQRPTFSTYMYNGLALNPAYAGSLNVFSAILTNRNQWVNIDGAPVYQSLTAHTTFLDNQVGVGLNVTRDAVGVHEQYSAYPSLAYKIRMSKWILSMGMQGGIDYRVSNYGKLNIYNQDDPNLPPTTQNRFNPNFGAGLYLANREFFLGASIPYILTPKIVKEVGVNSNAREARYFYINGGMVKDISRGIKINPSILFRLQERSPAAFDINVNLIFNEIVYAGVSYRYQDSISLLAQLVLNENFRLAYAYDIPTNRDLGGFTAGSHEIMLNYRIKLKTSKKDGLCPVYF